jgi:hypothetical protein
MATAPVFQVFGILGLDDEQAKKSMADFIANTAKLAKAATDMAKTAEAGFGRLGDGIERQEKKVQSLGGAFKAVMGSMIVGQVERLTSSVLDATKTMDGWRSQLIGITGSAAGAAKEMASIEKFALGAGKAFKLNDIAEGKIKLEEMKEGFRTTKTTAEALAIATELAAKKHKDLGTTIQVVTQAFQGNQRASMVLARQYGFTAAQQIEMGAASKNGKVILDGGRISTEAFTSALQKYATTGLSVAQLKSEGLQGSLNRLGTEMTLLKDVVGEQLAPMISSAANFIADMADKVRNADPVMLRLGAVITAGAVALVGLAAAAAPVIYGISSLISVITALVAVPFAALFVEAAPVIAAVALGLGALYEVVQTVYAVMGEDMPKISVVFTDIAKAIISAVSHLKEFYDWGKKVVGLGEHKPEGKGIAGGLLAPTDTGVGKSAWSKSSTAQKVFSPLTALLGSHGEISDYFNGDASKKDSEDLLPRPDITDKTMDSKTYHVKMRAYEQQQAGIREQSTPDPGVGKHVGHAGGAERAYDSAYGTRQDLSAPTLAAAAAKGITPISATEAKDELKDLQEQVKLGQMSLSTEKERLTHLQERLKISKDEKGQEDLLDQTAKKILETERLITQEKIKGIDKQEKILKAQDKLTPQMEMANVEKKFKLLSPGGVVSPKDIDQVETLHARWLTLQKEKVNRTRDDANILLGIEQGETAKKIAELTIQGDAMRRAGHDELDVVKIISAEKQKVWAAERIAHIAAVSAVLDQRQAIVTEQRTTETAASQEKMARGHHEQATAELLKENEQKLQDDLTEIDRKAAETRDTLNTKLKTPGISADDKMKANAELLLLPSKVAADKDQATQTAKFGKEGLTRAEEAKQREEKIGSAEVQDTAFSKVIDIEKAKLATTDDPAAQVRRILDLLNQQADVEKKILDLKKSQVNASDMSEVDKKNALAKLNMDQITQGQAKVAAGMATYDQAKAQEKASDEKRRGYDDGPKMYSTAAEANAATAAESKAGEDDFMKRSDAEDRAQHYSGLAAKYGVSAKDVETADRAQMLPIASGGAADFQAKLAKAVPVAQKKLTGGIQVSGTAKVEIILKSPDGTYQNGGVDVSLERAASQNPSTKVTGR